MSAFSWAKLFGSFFTGMHWVKAISLGLSAAMIAFTGYGLYKAYIKQPPPTTDQRAERIENYYSTPKVTFGCATTKTYQKYPTNRMN